MQEFPSQTVRDVWKIGARQRSVGENHILDKTRFFKGKMIVLFCNGETPILNNEAEVDASPNPALSILQLCKLTVTLSTLEVSLVLPEKKFGHPHNIWLHQHVA